VLFLLSMHLLLNCLFSMLGLVYLSNAGNGLVWLSVMRTFLLRRVGVVLSLHLSICGISYEASGSELSLYTDQMFLSLYHLLRVHLKACWDGKSETGESPMSTSIQAKRRVPLSSFIQVLSAIQQHIVRHFSISSSAGIAQCLSFSISDHWQSKCCHHMPMHSAYYQTCFSNPPDPYLVLILTNFPATTQIHRTPT
jgi:hypothetical protein